MTDRLDRIEAILERTAQRQEQLAQQQQQFDQRLDQLLQAIGESREEIDLLAERMGEIAESVSSLKQDREDTWAALNRFMGVMVQFQEQAAADRAVIVENQAEIRRIWEYLLRQHPNGHGDS
jgi:uncharacterized coiled-coil DUF342 family protein